MHAAHLLSLSLLFAVAGCTRPQADNPAVATASGALATAGAARPSRATSAHRRASR